MVFEDDPIARLRPVGTRDVRNAHPCEQEAEGDQENYKDLLAEMADVAIGHRGS
jgi:hypothetical protein